MDKSKLAKIAVLLSLSSISCTVLANSNSNNTPLKPFGFSVGWSQHELDLDILNITTNIPGVTPAQLDAVKGQLNAKSRSRSLNLQLDYQVSPIFNIYGAIGKVTDTTEIDLSSVLPGVTNFVSDHDGKVYTVGARLTGKYGQWVPSINASHSRIDLDGNSQEIKVNTITPSLGRITGYGLFSASLLYQSIEADYESTTNVPQLGAVPVVVSTENKKKWHPLFGWSARFGRDFFVNANVGLGDEKQLHLQLNKRF